MGMWIRVQPPVPRLNASTEADFLVDNLAGIPVRSPTTRWLGQKIPIINEETVRINLPANIHKCWYYYPDDY
jgi:hypothetical protein